MFDAQAGIRSPSCCGRPGWSRRRSTGSSPRSRRGCRSAPPTSGRRRRLSPFCCWPGCRRIDPALYEAARHRRRRAAAALPHDHRAAAAARAGRRRGLPRARRAAAVRSGLRPDRRRTGHRDRAAVALRLHRADAAASLRLRVGAVDDRVPARRFVVAARLGAGDGRERWRESAHDVPYGVARRLPRPRRCSPCSLLPLYWMAGRVADAEAALFDARRSSPPISHRSSTTARSSTSGTSSSRSATR